MDRPKRLAIRDTRKPHRNQIPGMTRPGSVTPDMSAFTDGCRRFGTSRPTGYPSRMADPKRRHSDISADISEHPAYLKRLAGRTFFRRREAAGLGLDSRTLRRLVAEGTVERTARGLYRSMETEPNEHYTEGAVCARVPGAIVCLVTALNIHLIGTQLPRKVWIGIPHKARAPHVPELPIRVLRFSGISLRYGVVDATFDGVPGRITTPARTVVDCFRFRSIVGLDVALEALRDALYDRKATPDQIWRAAEACRAKSLVRPALEAHYG